jgi:hypothetical protein
MALCVLAREEVGLSFYLYLNCLLAKAGYYPSHIF